MVQPWKPRQLEQMKLDGRKEQRMPVEVELSQTCCFVTWKLKEVRCCWLFVKVHSCNLRGTWPTYVEYLTWWRHRNSRNTGKWLSGSRLRYRHVAIFASANRRAKDHLNDHVQQSPCVSPIHLVPVLHLLLPPLPVLVDRRIGWLSTFVILHVVLKGLKRGRGIT